MANLKEAFQQMAKGEDERATCCSGGRLPAGERAVQNGGPSQGHNDHEGHCEADQEPDLVNSPPHYVFGGGIEAIDVIDIAIEGMPGREAHYAGCAMKYLLRANRKGKKLQDLKKAQYYLNRLVSIASMGS